METIQAPVFSLLPFPDPTMPYRDFHLDAGCTRDDCQLIHEEDSALLALVDFMDMAEKSVSIMVPNAITCEEVRPYRTLCVYMNGGACTC